MEQLEPLKPTFERDEIEKRINKLYEEEGEINREFTEKPSIHDLIYDELRNLNGALASLSAGNEIYLKAIVNNTGSTADRLAYVRDNTAVVSEHLESVDERLVEANNLLADTRDKTTMTQTDVDLMVKHYNEGEEMKKVEFSKAERHILYRALGSRASTLRNQIGYTRVDNDGTLRDQITKCEKLIRKIKDS